MVWYFHASGRTHYGADASWQRHDHVRGASGHTAIAGFALGAKRGVRDQSKTVAKWRKRPTVEDQKAGPKEPRSTVLSETDEAMVVACRRHTLLLLDDCLYAFQATIPYLTRSALHPCLQRHGISRLPDSEGNKPKRLLFKR